MKVGVRRVVGLAATVVRFVALLLCLLPLRFLKVMRYTQFVL